MIISLIAALASQRVIGLKNSIPWRLPADLMWFKRHTLNKPVIMGRQTFESIGYQLPGRLNIVLGKSSKNESGIIWVNSLNDACTAAGNAKEVMVMGGGSIYRQFIESADRMYLTHIDARVNGDTYFPNYKNYKWEASFIEHHDSDKLNTYSYYFEILDRC